MRFIEIILYEFKNLALSIYKTIMEQDNYAAKIVLLGSNSVGKSQIVNCIINHEFAEEIEPTIGASFSSKRLEIDGKKIQLEIWDTAGSDRYKSLLPMYYRGAAIAIGVYDITNKESWIELTTLLE